jgi:hypothetical protein
MIRWHRAGWKLFWRLKSRLGRPAFPIDLQKLIRRMANENPSWGEERIANELLLKLDIRVSARTVSKCLPRRVRGADREATCARPPTATFADYTCSSSLNTAAGAWSIATSPPIRVQPGRCNSCVSILSSRRRSLRCPIELPACPDNGAGGLTSYRWRKRSKENDY